MSSSPIIFVEEPHMRPTSRSLVDAIKLRWSTVPAVGDDGSCLPLAVFVFTTLVAPAVGQVTTAGASGTTQSLTAAVADSPPGTQIDKSQDYFRHWPPQGRPALFRLKNNLILAVPEVLVAEAECRASSSVTE
jgi:hypothetical protein